MKTRMMFYALNLKQILWDGVEGQDLIEYDLLLALVVLAAVVAFPPLASAIKLVFSNATNELTNPPSN